MIRVSYKTKEGEVKSSTDSSSFMLANKRGGYLMLSPSGNITKYMGFYFARKTRQGWELCKTVESISLIGVTPNELLRNLHSVELRSGKTVEKFFMNHSDSFNYSVENFHGEAKLVLDCRKMHDFHDMGRIYRIKKEKDCIVISYTKYADEKLRKRNYAMHVAIKGIKSCREIKKWVNAVYPYDVQRGSVPASLYVFDALRIKVEGNINLFVACSGKKQDAINKANYLKNNIEYIKKSKIHYTREMCHTNLRIRSDEVRMAYQHSIKAMDDLTQEINSYYGIYAGLPWFHQFWARDEAISLKSLMLLEKFPDAKRIIFRQLDNFLNDGRIKNRFPEYSLGPCLESADGVGWLFKRVSDLVRILKKHRKLNEYLPVKGSLSLNAVRKKLEISLSRIIKNYGRNGLVFNRTNETWMDTDFDKDVRDGFRIEIQALHLAMLKLMKELSQVSGDKENYKKYKGMEKETAEIVRKRFLEGDMLLDGVGDYKVRPNVFLAYYIYPELLSKSQWKKVFDFVLKKLWLDFGGLSTIDKGSYLFCNHHTGQDNRSYHRGDSWFWVNNIAALCMHRLGVERYRPYINSILRASMTDILYKGVAGVHSEISSASEQRAEGCWAQAWSSATFIELVHEVYGRGE